MITEANRSLDGETLVEGCLVFSPHMARFSRKGKGQGAKRDALMTLAEQGYITSQV
jgi:hypothetical protein